MGPLTGPPERPCVATDAAALGLFAADAIATKARAAIAARGRFDLVLAGGSTPAPTYHALAGRHRDDVPWDRVHVWYGDERCVPPDHPKSNHRAAAEALLARVPIDAAQVHRMRGEIGAGAGADDYEETLRATFHGVKAPAFDLVLLGLGGDGHTASLFPGAATLEERLRWVAPAHGPEEPKERVTLTLAGLAGAREIVFLVTGASKRAVLAEILSDPVAAAGRYPAAAVGARRPVAWWTDAEAAGRPPGGTSVS